MDETWFHEANDDRGFFHDSNHESCIIEPSSVFNPEVNHPAFVSSASSALPYETGRYKERQYGSPINLDLHLMAIEKHFFGEECRWQNSSSSSSSLLGSPENSLMAATYHTATMHTQSTSSSSSSCSAPAFKLPLQSMPRGRPAAGCAFKPYICGAAKTTVWMSSGHVTGQRMMKMVISISRSLEMKRREEALEAQQSSWDRPFNNQVHHMICERKRREKLNESFLALRSLLPPGSKKDKASVLASTKTYLNTLKAKVSELEEKNREMERQLDVIGVEERISKGSGGGDAGETLEVKITRKKKKTGEHPERLLVKVVVAVRSDSNVAGLIHNVTECLMKTSAATLVAMEASASPNYQSQATASRLSFTLHVKEDALDEESLRAAIAKAVGPPRML